MIDNDLFRKSFSIASGLVAGVFISAGILLVMAKTVGRIIGWIDP